MRFFINDDGFFPKPFLEQALYVKYKLITTYDEKITIKKYWSQKQN